MHLPIRNNKHYHTTSIQSELMKWLNLDINYYKGKGNYLYYKNKSGKKQKVLDLSGSYGINMLGHNHPKLKSYIHKIQQKNAPTFAQLTYNKSCQKLENKLMKHLINEGVKEQYHFMFASTGSESVENALRIAFLQWNDKRVKIQQRIFQSLNRLQSSLENQDKLIDLLGFSTLKEAISYHDDLIDALQITPIAIHLDHSFHGKTPGAYSVLSNKEISFPKSYHNISITDVSSLSNQVHLNTKFLKILHKRLNKTVNLDFSSVFSFIFEPIQGEGGIKLINSEFLREAVAFCKKRNIVTISDEIQSGIFRCGYFASCHRARIYPDLYIFGKALGGGFAKISTVAYPISFEQDSYAMWQTSTFGKDHFSCKVALRTLKIIEKDYPKQQIPDLKKHLLTLKEKYPSIIKSITGTGLMVGINFYEKSLIFNFLFKFINDLNKIGYLLASLLLNREHIRVFPSISAPLTLRIQPSIYFNENDLERMINGFESLLSAIENKNEKYLLSSVKGIGFTKKESNKLPTNLKRLKVAEGAAFFLCHPIDVLHAKNIVTNFQSYSNQEIIAILTLLSDVQCFSPYFQTKIKSNRGVAKDVVFLGIPLTSQNFIDAIRTGKTSSIVNKIQQAIDYANSYKASSIGLGQFTSIITQNGTSVHSDHAVITTGNNYTAALSHQSLIKSCNDQRVSIKKQHAIIYGAGGNIISVLTDLLASEVKSITLVYRQIPTTSISVHHPMVKQLKCLLFKVAYIDLSPLAVKDYIVDNKWNKTYGSFINVFENKAPIINRPCIYVLGTNSTVPILMSEDVASGSIVLDIAVPSNADQVIRTRPDITYLKGGMAKLPLENGHIQSLNSSIFPFSKGECFACMAETIGVALTDQIPYVQYTGELNTVDVLKVEEMMKIIGFTLGENKKLESF